jgi:hypothetical protein
MIASTPSGALAQTDATDIGTLDLKATSACISVYSPFTGDDNGNNVVTVKYRPSGSGDWIEVGSITVDRRDTVVSDGATISNLYKNQWRGSIVGLSANTEYEVEVTYSDDDGVNGTNPVTDTITTRRDSVPLGTGTAYYVATTGSDTNDGTEDYPFQTIQKAADTVQAGDTVYIKAGTYYEKVTITASGTANDYITFLPYGDGDVVIDGQSTQEYGIAIGVSGIVGIGSGTQQGGHYVRVSGLEIIDSKYAGINVGGDNVYIDNCEITNFNQADDQNADHRTSGITVNNWGASNMNIIDNTIVRNIGTPGVNAPMGIHIRNEHADEGGGHIIADNLITCSNRQIKDGIGGLPNFTYTGSLYRDSDISDNYIEGVYDDAIESEGGNINVRIWGNTLEDPYRVGLGIGSTIIGPVYIFRNIITGFQDVAIKMGHESSGTTYLYHNTVYTTYSANGPSDSAGYDGIGNVISRNNIYQVGRYVVETIGTDLGGNSYDYDNMYTTDGSRFVKWHNTLYTSLAAFQTIGQAPNAVSADSQFVDAANDDLSLQSTSPCIEAGVLLLGFNDKNSAWPYQGSVPDMGAFEYEMLTSWDSYSDSGHESQCDLFSDATHTVYMYGEGAVNGYMYRIVYWSVTGEKVREEDKAGESGVLSLAGYDFHSCAPEDAGYWQVTVYPTNYQVMSYDPDDVNIIMDDTSHDDDSSFYVHVSAIPEFPTALTGIIIVGLCFGIYYWMRKRHLTHVRPRNTDVVR